MPSEIEKKVTAKNSEKNSIFQQGIGFLDVEFVPVPVET